MPLPLAASAMSHVTKLDTSVGTCAAQAAQRRKGTTGSVQWRYLVAWRASVKLSRAKVSTLPGKGSGAMYYWSRSFAQRWMLNSACTCCPAGLYKYAHQQAYTSMQLLGQKFGWKS